MFSLATNVCVTDVVRIRHALPSWLRVFGARMAELLIVVDQHPPSGRIALLHGTDGVPSLSDLHGELDRLAKLDSRIRVIALPELNNADSDGLRSLKTWFGPERPVRCQLGTPIYAFVHAAEAARGPLVLRADCDMLFFDAGWIEKAEQLLKSGEVDLIEPPLLAPEKGRPAGAVSSRAFMLHKERFAAKLPIPAHKLDLARRIHRRLKGRPTWLALEDMLTVEKIAGRIKHSMLDSRLGFSLHVPTRQDMAVPWFHEVVQQVEQGNVPQMQREYGPNYLEAAWRATSATHPMAGDSVRSSK